MPTYAYECTAGHQFEGYTHSHKDPCPACIRCGEATDKIWKVSRHIGGVNWPLTTKHLTGKEETFQNQADLDRRCKELGLVQRDDVGWIEDEYQGVDFRTGQQKYKKGSGVGMPGCWV